MGVAGTAKLEFEASLNVSSTVPAGEPEPVEESCWPEDGLLDLGGNFFQSFFIVLAGR
jgi:hypothetical protein